MKIGVKIWPDRLHQLKGLSKFCDFIELMVPPSLKKVKKVDIPLTIHAPHSRFKMNPADSRLDSWNTKLMEQTIRIADQVKSKIIVLHAGELLNKSCSVKKVTSVLSKHKDVLITASWPIFNRFRKAVLSMPNYGAT